MSRLSFHSSQGRTGACRPARPARPGRAGGPMLRRVTWAWEAICSLTVLVGVMAATLTGCSVHGRMAIPAQADRIGSGSGAKLTVVNVMRFGRLHVLDRDDDTILWAGDVQLGQTLVINGFAHKVLLDGRTVAEGVVAKHHYVVFLS